MKTLFALVLALGLSSLAMAQNLNETSLQTLLTTPGTILVGDVHANETVRSIMANAEANGAKIVNECTPVSKKVAKCILWITYTPIGETALVYEVELPGSKLLSSTIEVARGD